MPRIRTIKPEFWEDEAVGMLTREARLLFIATWNLADDEGQLRWSSAYLKASVFMYDDDISVADVDTLMKELESFGLIYPYRGGKANQQLGFVVHFHTHQKINRPSPAKLPSPSPWSDRARWMYGERDGWLCHICNESIDPETTDKRLKPSIDHVEPKSKGGSNRPSNLHIAHFGCNSSKGAEPFSEPLTEPSLSDTVEVVTDSLSEGKGKEGKGRERKGTELAPAARERDPLWDAAAEKFGTPKTPTERGKRNKELKELRDAGVTPEELEFAIQKSVLRWPDARSGLRGIIRNLGDLLDGFDVSEADVAKYQDEVRKLNRQRRAQELDAEARGLPS